MIHFNMDMLFLILENGNVNVVGPHEPNFVKTIVESFVHAHFPFKLVKLTIVYIWLLEANKRIMILVF